MNAQRQHEDGWIEVAPDRLADWLVRSALPTFCALGGMFDDDAAWFRQLEPYQGHTPSGRLKGWSGAGRRVLAVEERVSAAYRALLHQAHDVGRPVNVNDRPATDREAEAQVRGAAVFARKVMLPSRVGWDAYRVLARIERLTADAGHFYRMDDDAAASINAAWREAWTALSDRALLDQLVDA